MEHDPYRPVLLIEDNPLDIDLTIRAFNQCQLQNSIRIARDGDEAISYIERWDAGEVTPLFILLDLKLPKRSGLDVLQTLKLHPLYKSIPVIVLTSSREPKDIDRAYSLGANSYIQKPVDFKVFREIASCIASFWIKFNLLPR